MRKPIEAYREEMQLTILDLKIKTELFFKKIREMRKGPKFDLNQKNSDNYEA